MGPAPNLQLYAARVDQVIGVDINSAMHPYALRAAEAAGVADKLRLLTGRAEALPLENESCDAVIMTHVSSFQGLPFRFFGPSTVPRACLVLEGARLGTLPSPPQVLCTVSDQRAALAEARRVLRPGGRFIFLEHVAAPPGERLASVQRWLNPAVGFVGHGCSCTRSTLDAIEAAGWTSLDAEPFRLSIWGPAAVIAPHIAGTAVK